MIQWCVYVLELQMNKTHVHSLSFTELPALYTLRLIDTDIHTYMHHDAGLYTDDVKSSKTSVTMYTVQLISGN
jgi:hypothetical protein